MKILTLGVLAGAYRANQNQKATLTHSFDVESDWETAKTLCKRIRGENMADRYSATEEESVAKPTCETCLKRDPRFQEGSR